jgi:hypothetical protein
MMEATIEDREHQKRHPAHIALAGTRVLARRMRRNEKFNAMITLYEWKCSGCETITNGSDPEKLCRLCGEANIIRDLTAEETPTDQDSGLPQLRDGERSTGELFQDANSPFNLAGESYIDFDARARAAEQIEADKAASNLLQETMPI